MNNNRFITRIQGLFLERWHPFAWIALTALLLYAHTVSFGFTYLDDYHLIEQNAAFLSDISNLPQAFTENAYAVMNKSNAYYRPLLFVSFMLDAQIAGTAPYVYHLSNTLLHIVTAWLVLMLFRRLSFSHALSFLMAMLYTAHPVLTQTVIWIPCRCDLILAFFFLISLLCFMCYIKNGNGFHYVGHLVALLLAYFTKESAFAILLICIAYTALLARPNRPQTENEPQSFKKRLMWASRQCLWIEWTAITIFWFGIRIAVLGALSIQTSIPAVLHSMITTLPGIVQLYGKTLLPFNLSVLPLQQDTSCLYGSAAIMLTVLTLIIAGKGRRNMIAWGLLWFLLALLPMFIRPMNRGSADLNLLEHRLNLPLVGIMIAMMESGVVQWLRRNWRIGLLVWVLVFSVFSTVTIKHAAEFRDPITFWESAARTSPHSPFAHKNLGVIYYIQGRLNDAEREYKKALELRPMETIVHNNLGLVYMDKGLDQQAEAEFKTEIELHPRHDKPYYNLGRLYEKQGRKKEAQYWRAKAPKPQTNPAFGRSTIPAPL